VKEEKDDPRRPITLEVLNDDGSILFSVTWDEARIFRMLEAAAQALPDEPSLTAKKRAELARFKERMSPAAFDASPVVLPPAAALAREANTHFRMTVPEALKREFLRVLQSAYITGGKALADFTRAAAGEKEMQLPAGAIGHPVRVMSDSSLTDIRNRQIDVAADNARVVHPKRSGAGRKHNYEELAVEVQREIQKGNNTKLAYEIVGKRYGMDADALTRSLRRHRKKAPGHN